MTPCTVMPDRSLPESARGWRSRARSPSNPKRFFSTSPFANVDADVRPALRALVRAYADRTGCDLVLATSSFADSAALCRNAVVLRGGRVVHAGTTDSLAASGEPYARAFVEEASRS
jgi:ABC-type uncharacterized transport system ATPase subunit